MECIGTLECSTSSRSCGQWLNSSEGRNSAAGNRRKPLVTLAMWATPSFEGGRFSFNLHHCLPARTRRQFIPPTALRADQWGFLPILV
ncbi:MAG: hypothetical protein ACFFD4_22505 [Candidatus Odinarchaeota archaeon]